MFSKNIAITDTTDGLPNPRRIWAVIAASLALIMSVLDANIVNVVLPTLSREFGTSPSTTIWVMNVISWLLRCPYCLFLRQEISTAIIKFFFRESPFFVSRR